MARNTFQGRLRTYAGRSKSNINRLTGIPTQLLPQNLAGPIQVVLRDPADGAHNVGLLPAYWCIERVRVITGAGAGTYQLDLPEYGAMAAVGLVAASDATSNLADATLDAGLLSPWGQDRPLVLTTTGVTGLFRVGIFGFPLDNALEQDN
jgi:hypothetical protein